VSSLEKIVSALDPRIAGIDTRLASYDIRYSEFSRDVGNLSSVKDNVEWMRSQLEKMQGEIMPVMVDAKSLPQNFIVLSKTVENIGARLVSLDNAATNQKNEIFALKKELQNIKSNLQKISSDVSQFPIMYNALLGEDKSVVEKPEVKRFGSSTKVTGVTSDVENVEKQLRDLRDLVVLQAEELRKEQEKLRADEQPKTDENLMNSPH
jgi:chromosome segregation ATPase